MTTLTSAFAVAQRARPPSAFARLLASGLCAWAMFASPSSSSAEEAPTPAASAALAEAPASASAIPTATFANLPMLSQVVLSPDGKRIAALLNEADRTVLITRGVDERLVAPVLVSDNEKFLFNWVRWVSNDRLVVSVRFAARRGFVGTLETRLFSVDADGSGLVDLVVNRSDPGSVFSGVRSQQLQDQVIDWLPGDGQHLLLQLADAGGILPAVYQVDVHTGARRSLQSPQRDVHRWITDAQHRVRVGVRQSDGDTEIIGRDPDGSDWRTLWRFRDGPESVWPLGFGLDPQELFVRADHDGRGAVFAVRLDQPGLPRTLRFANPRFDVEGSLLHAPGSGEVVGLRSNVTEDGDGQKRSELWDPAWRGLARAIDTALARRDNRLLDMSADEKHYLVYSSGNGQPGEYYLGNRSTGELSLLAATYPGLDPARLAGKRPVTIAARDGLRLQAFLTRPKASANGPLAMVLLPHGGPQSRDGQDFDTWTEFLAARGYAVLQVNFRGSTGIGREFAAAGLQRWGLEMQDDLTDAVHWAVDRHVADPARICVVGASYGGYAALMGLVKTPELYRCGVSFAGVTDLLDLMQFEGDYVGGAAAMERMFGGAWRDRARLKATSPALLADKIQAPVLLVHGSADRVVPVEQSEDMAKALRRAGKTYRYIEQEGGDHQLSRNANRLELFEAMEAFLAENLKPVGQ